MRKWGITKKLYWCHNCNVPLRTDKCGICGGNAHRVSIMEPGDLRPAFEGDIKLIREALINEFNSDILIKDLSISIGTTYLNKVPHVDDMKEIIVGGVSIGRLYFDPKYLMWRWRLAGYSTLVAIRNDLVKVYVRDKVRPLEILGDCLRDGDQAVVVNKEGEPIALAVCRRGKFRVQAVYKGKTKIPILNKKSTLDDVLKANEDYLRELISKSIKHLYVMSNKVNLPIVLSYSGGKDSLLSLHLTLNAGLEPKLLFNDTGIELPPVIKNVHEVSSKYGLELIEASAGNKFWEAVEVFGPPAKDYRWCCKVVKLAPIASTYKRLFPSGLLAIIGQRAMESIDRSWTGSVWRNKWLPHALNITPIREWDQLSEWLYIIKHKLPVNELYFKGFDRLGCFLCPAAYIAEYHIVSREFPDVWRRWVEVLEKWRLKLNKDANWVRYHLWRWLDPLGQGRRRVEIWLGMKKVDNWVSELYFRLPIRIDITEESNKKISAVIHNNKFFEGIKENYMVVNLSPVSLKNDSYLFRRSKTYIKIIYREKKVIIEGDKVRETFTLILKLGIRYALCVKCGLCSTVCPMQAITINEKDGLVIKEGKCIGCLSCIELCPISKLLVDKVVLPAIFKSRDIPKVHSTPYILELIRQQRRVMSKSKEVTYDFSHITDFWKGIEGNIR